MKSIKQLTFILYNYNHHDEGVSRARSINGSRGVMLKRSDQGRSSGKKADEKKKRVDKTAEYERKRRSLSSNLPANTNARAGSDSA
jgi:hypothetical protein